MRVTDEQGRLWGKVNVIDLGVVVAVCVVVVVAYVQLTAPYRVAPQFALPHTRTAVEVDLRLPPDQTWMERFVVTGLQQRDPRSGEIVAEVLGCRSTEDGGLAVDVRLVAVRDPGAGEGRLMFGNRRLVPGELLRIETEGCVIEGRIARIVVTRGRMSTEE